MEYIVVALLGWIVVPVLVLLALYYVIRVAVRHALADVRSGASAARPADAPPAAPTTSAPFTS